MAALQTPKQRAIGLARPSFGHVSTASSPTLRASTTDINRKASLQALTGQAPSPSTGSMIGDLEIGDAVNVPGDMHGVVKFIGSVRGKNGQFVGVELDRQFAAKGKNDGDVDGVTYFETSIRGAGIFLPVHRAEKRYEANGTPTTPSFTAQKKHNGVPATTPAIKPSFSQSVGPGARPSSPTFKAKRPSLPRPESPLRKQPSLAPTPAKTFSQSVRGTTRPPISQTPSKPSLRASTNRTAGPPTQTTRPYSRNNSRLGSRSDAIDEEHRPMPSFSQSVRPASRQGSANGVQDQEVQRLRKELVERDRRLNEQAASLAEMENSVKELSALLTSDSAPSGGHGEDAEEKNAAQLRQMLREKNEKISKLTAEFDAHRADFRSTLDSLEMASTETERVYEEQKRDLLAQLAEMQDAGQSKEDFEGVARQLKQLEEFVAELEEGLEESRRGEAEARGEVEFLRGEVERGRSELRREREKAAAAMKHSSITSSGSSIKDLEQRDDEIRGLKAIIHSLSEAGSSATTNATSVYSGTDGQDADGEMHGEEMKRLQHSFNQMQIQKESLENELEQLRRERSHNSNSKLSSNAHIRNESDHTEKGASSRPRSNTIKPTPPLFDKRPRQKASQMNGSTPLYPTSHNEDAEFYDAEPIPRHDNAAGGSSTYCEMCESAEHDTLDCTKLTSASHERPVNAHAQPDRHYDIGKDNTAGDAKAAGSAVTPDSDKWCALCEQTGHLAFDCPEEQY